MLFQRDKNVLCIATKQETAKNMVTKVKFAYDNLPSWLKINTSENNKLSLKLTNGSQIKAIGATGDAGRSEAVSLLLLDEAAFIEGIDEIFASAQQTLATGGQCIAISTPYGTGNWFHKTFIGAEENKNGFVALKLPWVLHPERTQKWRDE
jgi:phage FluMu gp28-like protein